METIRVDGANGIRFSTRKIFSPGNGLLFNGPITSTASTSDSVLRKADINPNKAVFTIDSKNSNILIVNNKACQLLNYRPSELCEMKFSSLLTNKTNKCYASALSECQFSSEGSMVVLSGKVIEMITKNGSKVAVSLWVRQIDADGRCLAVAEPVERRIAQIVVDKEGKIKSIDNEALVLFQLDSADELLETDIKHLIPAIQLPSPDRITHKTMFKQKATGKTKDNLSFPLCLMITAQSDESASQETPDDFVPSTNSYGITVCVFQNISGLFVINESGLIEMCNHHFAMLMFGFTQTKITRMYINQIIPDFGQEHEYLGVSEWNYNGRSRNITFSSLNNESETETDPIYYEAESFYATPIDTTGSDRSKSMYETSIYEMPNTMHSMEEMKPSDMSKAISEPISMCDNLHDSDQTQQKFSRDGNQQDLLQDTVESGTDARLTSLGKSFSDNMLGAGSPIVRDHSMMKCHIKREVSPLNTMVHVDPIDKEDEISNCDASELLTPVNENAIKTYLIEPAPTEASYKNELADELNELEDNVSIDVLEKKRASGNRRAHSSQANKNQRISAQPPTFNDGKYKGKAIHCDGNIFNILYTISSKELPCGRTVFCVWICRDEYDLDDEEDDSKQPNLTLTFNSITSNIETSVDFLPSTAKRNSMHVYTHQSSRPNSVSLISQYEDEQFGGEYNKYYTSLKQIGKGAFGYVKLSFRHSDRLLVVTKFILKDKLPPQFMVIADDKKEIPMEVYLLSTLKHPNIVTVLDVFENEKFFQLVMEKHGSGMDLFEFIDRRPLMDEKLGSYIFRQIVNAIDYLHSLKILHRDIKDENIIIDQCFHVKLIDFGSATFMEDGKLFSTFYGTTEYCSPEVLAGNKYSGPELEIWALGITLFVLTFFENPFIDIEETLHTELTFPHPVSPALENILKAMLDKCPRSRCTMKQLLSDPWTNQELNPCNFNFSWIVPCENHESNPEKYFTGQIYSSATGLSTTSPTSLADEEDSIIDDDIEDEELCELGTEFDYRKCRKSNEPNLEATNESVMMKSATMNASLQLPKNQKISSNRCNCNVSANTKRVILQDSDDECAKEQSNSCNSINSTIPMTREMQKTENMMQLRTGSTTSTTNAGASISPIISLSKSETNISESSTENSRNQLTIYNVVSLNNLHDSDCIFNRSLNEVSRNQCYANSYEDTFFDLNPKKHMASTNSKTLTTVTVSMRNTVDVSDDIF